MASNTSANKMKCHRSKTYYEAYFIMYLNLIWQEMYARGLFAGYFMLHLLSSDQSPEI